jgi:hypothetical protein
LNGAVTFSKFQNIAAQTILGNNSGGSSTVNNLGLLNGLIFNGTNLALGNITPTSVASSGAISGTSLTAVQSSSGKSVTFAPTGVTLTADRTLKPQNKSYTIADSADVPTQYWQKASGIISPVTNGDALKVVDASNIVWTYISNGSVLTGAIGGNTTSLGSDTHSFYQAAPNKQLDLKIRNLTSANRTVYFPNSDITVADSATVAGKLPLTAGSSNKLTGDLYINKANPTFILQGASVDMGMYGNGNTLRFTDQTTGTNGFFSDFTNSNFTVLGLGTGTVQATSGLLSVISDSRNKDVDTIRKINAYNLISKLPSPKYWNYNKKSGYDSSVIAVKQFGLLADEVHNALGEEFAPTQQKVDSLGNKLYGLSDRALLSLALQALKEQQAIIEDLKVRVAKLENK